VTDDRPIEEEPAAILRRYGVLCSTAAESNARAKALARMGEFTAREREILLTAGWLR
jgi:rhodanese-related sulfurtransferase